MDELRAHLIFSGLSEDEIRTFFDFAQPELIELDPGQKISIDAGHRRKMGIVLSGDAKVYTIDYDGNKTIINTIRGHGTIGTMQFMMEHYN